MSARIPCALDRFMHQADEAEKVKRAGWLNNRILVVPLDDKRLTPAERAALQQIGQKLYEGKGKS